MIVTKFLSSVLFSKTESDMLKRTPHGALIQEINPFHQGFLSGRREDKTDGYALMLIVKKMQAHPSR